MSYCPLFKIGFPDFSWLCFHISEWKSVTCFHLKSNRSSSTFVTVDLLFQELLPFASNLFSGLFLSMLSHIWMKVGSKLPYEELQIKFNFRHGLPTFSRVIALCLKFGFPDFSCLICFHIYISNNELKTHFIEGAIFYLFFIKKCAEIVAADLKLLGSVGDLYCFSNTYSMLVFLCHFHIFIPT